MFAERVKIVSHLSCRTSAIFKYFCPLAGCQKVASLRLTVTASGVTGLCPGGCVPEQDTSSAAWYWFNPEG